MSLTKLFHKQVHNNTISKKQRIMMNLFVELEQYVQNAKVKAKDDGTSTSLWSFLLGENKDMLRKMSQSIKNSSN